MRTGLTRVFPNDEMAIRKEQAMAIGERIIVRKQLKGEETEKIRTLFENEMWNVFFHSAKDDGNSCSLDTALENIKKMGKANLRESAAMLLGVYFDAVDHNKKGFIDQKDFTHFFHLLGITEHLAVSAFQALDTDRDGKLFKDEFVKAGEDFCIQEIECFPSDHFLGPI